MTVVDITYEKKKEVMVVDHTRLLHAVKDKKRYVCRCGWILRGSENYCSGCGVPLKWEV